MTPLIKTLQKLSGAAAIAALVVSAPLAVMPAPVRAQAAASELNQAVAALRGISTMRADFVQTDRNGQSMRGVITLQRPGKIRFQYAPGIPMLVVSDGSALTLIDYEVKQVQRWPIRNSPLGVLLDPNRDVSRYGKLQATNDPNVIAVEVRDRAHPEFGVITLVFVRKAGAPGGLELSSWVALDSQNKRTTVRLSNQQYGVVLAANAFRWKDPRVPTRR
ncbi:MAG: outer membrane lipoprotein carrier protein LolA [Novosphingobium sp.]